MLSDRELETALTRIEWRMDKLNTLYLEQVGEQVNAIGRLSPTSVNRLVQMRKAGASMDKINAELRRTTGKNTAEIEDLYKQAMQETYADYEFMAIVRGRPLVPLEYNTTLQRVLEAEAHETRRTMANLSNTTNISDRYREIVSDAVQAATTGVADYHSAMRSALRQAAEEGPRVTYESGVQRRLDTAIRMNVVDGVKHIQQQAQHIIGEEIGADGIEISAHPHSAPDHEPVQGRQFRHEEFERLQTGGACRDYDGNYYVGFQRPIGEWNCRHFAFDIVLGIAKRQHSDEELARWQKENEQGCTIDGQHYSIYEAGQLMRKIETAVRRQKDVATVARASGDDVLRRQAQKKISDLTAAYKRVSDASGLQTRAQRLYVSGFKDVKPAIVQSTMDISLPNINGVVPRGAEIQRERVIAGRGSSTTIRDVGYLVQDFGGDALQWTKVGGIIETGNFRYDVHWYELNGKQYKMKLKGVKEIGSDR